jgi:hypothetical protein
MNSLTSISLIRNEADIIEAFVRHHAQWVDTMVIVLHRASAGHTSSDNTEEILGAMCREGLPIELRTLETAYYEQEAAVNSVMREVAERQDSAWILPLDADEFLNPTDGAVFLERLDALGDDVARLLRWRTYVPTPSDDEGEPNVIRRMQHRRLVEQPQRYKVLVPCRLARKAGSRVTTGAHGFRTGMRARETACDLSYLAHFPLRSSSQIRAKVFAGWLSHLSNPRKRSGLMSHWKNLYDQLKTADEIPPSRLQELAVSYGLPRGTRVAAELTLDPVRTPEYELKYSRNPVDPWTLLSDTAETLAEEVAKRGRWRPGRLLAYARRKALGR